MSVSRFVESPGVIKKVPESRKQQALLSGSADPDGGIFFAVGQPLSLFDSGTEEFLPEFEVILWVV